MRVSVCVLGRGTNIGGCFSPFLLLNPNIRKLLFLDLLRRQPTAPGSGEPTSWLQRCEDDPILFWC